MVRVRRFLAAGFTVALMTTGAAVTAVPASAGATVWTPDTTADDESSGSLRYILELDVSDGDIVELEAGATYTLDKCLEVPDVDPEVTVGEGDIDIVAAVTIIGNGATIEQTCQGVRVLYTEYDLTLDGVTITGGTANGGGGGVRVDNGEGPLQFAVLNSSIVGNCSTGSGGGFKMNTDGSVSIYNSTIAGNETDDNGGGFSHSHTGDVYVENSTVSNNAGGGVGGVEVRNGDLTAVYSDIVDNEIIEGTSCDISPVAVDEEEDAAPSAVLGPSNLVVSGEGSVLRSFGTVVALMNNGDFNCLVDGTESSGYNYSDDDSCGFDQTTDTETGADPLLGALAANGGPTLTRLPQTGSPLIDAIPNAACGGGDTLAQADITTDQRAFERPSPVGGACDIGSVEIQVEVVEIQPTFTG